MPDAATTQRLERLETQLAYQEQTIEDLNRVVTEQWAEIARLRGLVGDLGQRLRELADNPALAEPPEAPPHY
jgi:SlyX protein